MNRMIQAYKKEPGAPWRIVCISTDMNKLMRNVCGPDGGLIEAYRIGMGGILLCDEDGREKNSPYNCTVGGVAFVGNLLIVGVDDEGEWTDVPFPFEKLEEVISC